jgi:cold shock CspA family protein
VNFGTVTWFDSERGIAVGGCDGEVAVCSSEIDGCVQSLRPSERVRLTIVDGPGA